LWNETVSRGGIIEVLYKAVQKLLYKQPFMIGLAIYASVGHEAQEQNQNINLRLGILVNTGCLQ